MLVDKAIETIDDSAGTRFLLYLLRHTDGDTQIFCRTYSQIQKDLGIPPSTIARYFKKLEDSGLLIHKRRSEWIVPAIKGYSDTCEGPEWYITNLGP